MNRPVVEFPLFYGDEREDVREFLGNYRRAGLLNGWDEEKLGLGLPLFLKKHACVWFKTLTEADIKQRPYRVSPDLKRLTVRWKKCLKKE